MIIYKATNKINNKCYIGQTIGTLEERIRNHKRYGFAFYNAIKKYGIDNFKWIILEICFSQEELNEKEIWYIKHFNSFGENGYNLTSGGENFIREPCSDETKKKIGDSNRGKKRVQIKKWSVESRNKARNSKLGTICSEEAKKKHSEAAKNNNNIKKWKDGHVPWNKGIEWSDEIKIKMSKSKKGKPWTEARRSAQKNKHKQCSDQN